MLARAMQERNLTNAGSAQLEAEKFLQDPHSALWAAPVPGRRPLWFPHLTFQEYLAARSSPSRPDRDYIDLVMADLHEAWWREVSAANQGIWGQAGRGRPRRPACCRDHSAAPTSRPGGYCVRQWVALGAGRVGWQFERRLAWVLARESMFVATSFSDFKNLGTNVELRSLLAGSAQRLLLQIVLEPGRVEV